MNIMKMMKQAGELQKKMGKIQEELAERTVEFSSGGGMVTVTARGDFSIAQIQINPDAVDPEDVEMLEDLVRAAVDGALSAVREMTAKEMAAVTNGLGGLPPGMKMPF